MKSRCRWKNGREEEQSAKLGSRRDACQSDFGFQSFMALQRGKLQNWSFGVISLLIVGCLVSPSVQQGNRPTFTSPGQSILPGGFQLQPFGQNPNFFTPRGGSTGRSSSGSGATSVQNTHFGFFPSTGPSGPSLNPSKEQQQQPLPSFIGLGPPPPPTGSNNGGRTNQGPKPGEIQYEYYDEPEDDVIYQYPTDLGLNPHPQQQKKQQPQQQPQSQPTSTIVGRGIAVDQHHNQHHSRFPQQTFTTAQLGSGSSGRFQANLGRGGSNGNNRAVVQLQQFIPLEEPEQPLQSLNGRSVLPPGRGSGSGGSSNNINIRPPPSLLRPSTNPTTTTGGTSTTSTTAGTSTTERSRLRVATATTRRPVPNPGRSRFSTGTTTTTKKTTTTTSTTARTVPSGSSSSRLSAGPEVGRRTQQHQPHVRNKENKYEGDDYTIEYIEYPESGGASPEEQGSEAGGGGGGSDKSKNKANSGFDYYEVSEETAKAILKDRKAASNAKPQLTKPEARVTSSSSVSKSSSSSVASSTATVSSSTTPSPPPEKKEKVVVSISSSKTVSGSVSKSSKVNPTVSSATTKPTAASTSTSPPPTSTSTTTTRRPASSSRSTTEPGLKDSLPSGAETSPEYYEEEYSYHEHQQAPQQPQPTKPSSSSSSSSSSAGPPPKETEEEEEETQEQEEQEEGHAERKEAEEPTLRHPQPRKLPSKKSENIPHSAFHTLVDFGDLDSEGRVPLLGDNNEQQQHQRHVEEEDVEENKKKTPSTTTTKAPPKGFGGIKFADISPDLLPPGFTFPPSSTSSSTTTTPEPSTSTTTTTTTTVKPTFTTEVEEAPISFASVPSFLLPKGYKSLGTKAPLIFTTTTKAPVEEVPIDLGSIPLNLLPKGYKLPSTTAPPPSASSPSEPLSPLEALLSKIKIQEIAIPSLIPKDYTPPPGTPIVATPPSIGAIPANLLPPGFKPPSSSDEGAIAYEIPANLLPHGYKKPATFTRAPPTAAEPTKKPIGFGPVFPTRPTKAPSSSGGVGPVFPTKPGGFRVTRPTTTEHPKADTPPPPKVTIAASGWPTRKTTEFTGWPTPSTTRPPPTVPTPSTTTQEPVTTPSTTTKPTTTTTPPPPKRSPLGVCPQEVCRMEATMRITGGVKWKPEFADINTEEYKHLELTVRRELDGAYRASGLAPWYKRVTIEGFNQGSVLVDYFVELEGVDRELTTSDVVKVFHKSLLDSDPGDELLVEGASDVSLRFGRYNIDPRYTDFKVVTPKTGKGSAQPDTLIPQWGIAVIVIGLVSLLFLLILGVIVLVSRYKNSKKKNNVSLTQEMLNEFNKSHMAVGGGGGRGHGGSGADGVGGGGGVDNFGADDLYNMDDVWNDNKQMDRTFDRRPTKRSQGGSSTKGSGGGGGANYNIYDSWKTEWNGYFHNGNYYGEKNSGYSGYAPSRRRSDYDTNF